MVKGESFFLYQNQNLVTMGMDVMTLMIKLPKLSQNKFINKYGYPSLLRQSVHSSAMAAIYR